jgi:V/A-type H+-transporting ATPase subunit E
VLINNPLTEMPAINQLEILTEKIYQEGIAKAQKESEELLAKAEAEKQKILENARQEAEAMLAKARQESRQLQERTLAELKLAGQQALQNLRENLRSFIAMEVLEKKASSAFNDAQFLQQLVLEVVKHWSPDQPIEIWFPQSLEEKTKTQLRSAIQAMVGQITLHFEAGLPPGFTLKETGKHIELSFTDESFAAFFRPLLRKATNELLFGQTDAY